MSGRKKRTGDDASKEIEASRGFEHRPLRALESLRASLPGAERAPETEVGDVVAPREPGGSAVPRETSEVGSRPPAGAIVVRRERKGRGGKTITRIAGLRERGAALEALARELKRGLGCGASVDGDELCLQGDLVARAVDALVARGYRGVRAGN
jgi:translation initiation factor 1